MFSKIYHPIFFYKKKCVLSCNKKKFEENMCVERTERKQNHNEMNFLLVLVVFEGDTKSFVILDKKSIRDVGVIV